jgi:hypothetical protein
MQHSLLGAPTQRRFGGWPTPVDRVAAFGAFTASCQQAEACMQSSKAMLLGAQIRPASPSLALAPARQPRPAGSRDYPCCPTQAWAGSRQGGQWVLPILLLCFCGCLCSAQNHAKTSKPTVAVAAALQVAANKAACASVMCVHKPGAAGQQLLVKHPHTLLPRFLKTSVSEWLLLANAVLDG